MLLRDSKLQGLTLALLCGTSSRGHSEVCAHCHHNCPQRILLGFWVLWLVFKGWMTREICVSETMHESLKSILLLVLFILKSTEQFNVQCIMFVLSNFEKFLLKWANQSFRQLCYSLFSQFVCCSGFEMHFLDSHKIGKGIRIMCMNQWGKKIITIIFGLETCQSKHNIIACVHLQKKNIRFILSNTHDFYDLIIIFFYLYIKTYIASEVCNEQISVEKSFVEQIIIMEFLWTEILPASCIFCWSLLRSVYVSAPDWMVILKAIYSLGKGKKCYYDYVILFMIRFIMVTSFFLLSESLHMN